MSGISWLITAEIACYKCGQKRIKDVAFQTAYKFNPDEEELDDIRSDLLMDTEIFEKWAVLGLETWDSMGDFLCFECQKKELEASAEKVLQAG